jgi:hypothetical protein
MNERRSTTRVAPAEPIPVKLKSSLPARVLDVSAGGVQIEVATSLRPAADCELRVQLHDGELAVRAKVRRCRAWGFGLDESDRRVLLYRAGLEFSDLAPESLERLRRHMGTQEATPVVSPSLIPGPAGGETTEGALVDGPTQELPAAPRSGGPVRIRINSEYVRRLLQGKDPK